MNLRPDKFISLLSKECIAVAISDTPVYESGLLLRVKLEFSSSTNQSLRRDDVLV